MAKANSPKTTNSPKAEVQAASAPVPPASNDTSILAKLEGFRFQAIIIALLSIVLYANTFRHEFAFDDMMAIVNNTYVQEGVSGIGKIMSSDAYQSYLEQKNGGNQLAGGRYRPLSLVTFAIEQQIVGVSDYVPESANGKPVIRTKEQDEKLVADMHFRHVVNVLLYALACVVVLWFLRKIVFPKHAAAAFFAAVLYTVHPLHTEVVANVKSRDEILSVLFICLTFICAFQFKENQEKKHLRVAQLCYFLALLSKEYAITLLVLLPLSFYVFRAESWQQSFKSLVPFLIPFGVYFLLRVASVSGPSEGAEKEIMNYPYLYATAAEALATKMYVLLMYIKMLLLPHPLSVDYSFKQIPYTNFSNPLVLLSCAIYVSLIASATWLTIRRNKFGFAIAFYLLNLFLVSNLLVNLGAPMGERLVFHSSIGFVVLLGALVQFVAIKAGKPAQIWGVTLALLLPITLVGSFATMARNPDWKNNTVLFLHDAQVATNSALVNNNAGSACMNKAKSAPDTAARRQWMLQAITYFDKTIAIHPRHMLAHVNRGLCHFNTGNPDKALPDWDTVRAHNPATPNLEYYLSILSRFYYAKAMDFEKQGKHQEAIDNLIKADAAIPKMPEIWSNLAVAYLNAGQTEKAKEAFAKLIVLDPNNTDAKNRLDQLNGAK